MFDQNFLLSENLRIRDENIKLQTEIERLQKANDALSHVLSCIMPELGSIRVPRSFTRPKGEIRFQSAPRDCVDIIFIEAPGRTSQTGDPILDNIFGR